MSNIPSKPSDEEMKIERQLQETLDKVSLNTSTSIPTSTHTSTV